MSRRTKVQALIIARENACGIGTRKIKLILNRLAKTDPLARAARIALEIEDANLLAKKYGGGKWSYRNYDKKGELIRELIKLFKAQGWVFGVQPSRHSRGVIYFEIPGCEQISFHYDHDGDPLPIYEKEWDKQEGSTLRKLFDFIQKEFIAPVRAQAQLPMGED